MLKIGDNAPDFTLTSDEGKEVSLKDFKGKRVLLYFYPKASTPGCYKYDAGAFYSGATYGMSGGSKPELVIVP